MAVKYTYTPIPPGCSDIVYCDVFAAEAVAAKLIAELGVEVYVAF